MMLSYLLGLLFPAKCVFCRKLLERRETDLCIDCRRELPFCEMSVKRLPYSESTTAVFYYETEVRASILRYKFHGMLQYSAAYGRLLAMKISEQEMDFDLISYVPVSRRRLHKRGYDQAGRLAKAVASELGLKSCQLLKKIRDNPAQSGIQKPEERRANVIGVYRVQKPSAIQGKRILLIDDVLTTGATLSECCRTLLDAGAAQVSCAVLATVRRDQKKQQVRT